MLVIRRTLRDITRRDKLTHFKHYTHAEKQDAQFI